VSSQRIPFVAKLAVMRALGYGLVLALALALAAAPARAFCRTSTCTSCKRDPVTGCTIGGMPLAWPEACVSFSLSRAAAPELELESARALMAEAFAVWESARCGPEQAKPSISVSDAFAPALCRTPEYNPQGGNANLIMFRSESWPYESSGDPLGATTLTFDDTGQIYDADIEINATAALVILPEPTADPDAGIGHVSYGVITGEYDVLTLMIHEAGHFLGLDHSREENSVMEAGVGAGVVRTRLSPDDVAAICSAYPPERKVPACDPRPRGGFSTVCDATPIQGGCSGFGPVAADGGGALGVLAALGVWSRIARRGRRSSA
jgi:Matrixin